MSINPAYISDPVYSPEDVSVINGVVHIDLSRDTPSPQASLAAEIFEGWSDASEAGDSDKYVPDDYVTNNDIVPVPGKEPELRYTLPNVVDRLYLVVGDETLKANLSVFFRGTDYDGTYNRPANVYTQLPNGSYAVRSHFCRYWTDHVVCCAGLIAAALNNYRVDNHGFLAGFLPLTVPVRAMKECNLHVLPSIILFLSRGWMLKQREFPTVYAIEQHINHFFSIIRFAAATFTKIMITTMRMGSASVCNPGAGIGMSKDEFIARAGCPTAYTDFVECWIDRMLDSNEYIREADDSAGAFFAERSIRYLLEVTDRESVDPGVTATLVPHTPHESTFNAHFTGRIGTTPSKLGLQLAMIGF
ncbi:hypothetical protein GGX14DRAFT_570835 [Mycena pura]|uniref:Uncharacterized protein n=1 Tax=Mycena pura TaxID=153505 RepID=A0AAD6V8B0_9AGAR|nr:hypothetical protein GGX14DRAFT_570835 [Mycena pura]